MNQRPVTGELIARKSSGRSVYGQELILDLHGCDECRFTREDIERIRRPPEDPSRPRPPPFRRLLDEMPFPETKPAHGELVVDAAGNLWVAEYRLRVFETTAWTVFDPQGTLLGNVEVPRGSRVRQIGHNHVLATWRDEDDVEHVRMYELVKP